MTTREEKKNICICTSRKKEREWWTYDNGENYVTTFSFWYFIISRKSKSTWWSLSSFFAKNNMFFVWNMSHSQTWSHIMGWCLRFFLHSVVYIDDFITQNIRN
jgi:hypothetical protein